MNSEDFDLIRFGHIIEEIRKSKNIKKLDVRKNTGIHSDTLKFLEYGKKLPNTDTLARLGEYYGISLFNILDECRYENNEYVISIIDRFDKMSYLDCVEDIVKLRKELLEHINNFISSYPPRTTKKLQQLDLLMQIIFLKNKKDIMNVRNSEALAIEALRISHPNFHVHLYDRMFYNSVELRILLLLAFSLVRQQRNSVAINITKYIINILHKHMKSTPELDTLLLQAHFNLSYIF